LDADLMDLPHLFRDEAHHVGADPVFLIAG